MQKKITKILSVFLCSLLIFQQSGFAQVATQLDISSHLLHLRSAFAQDKFRPLHLRYLEFNPKENGFRLLLDKGDTKNLQDAAVEQTTKELLRYFFVGLALPNDSFWVNLRPDSPDNIIDPLLAETDVGRILLEADVQLKKDTASFTSPQTPEGKEYWDKLYQKAGELFGSENITIPTLTRPWIVPDEIIVREAQDNAYIYKATLKVMLEQDYLKDSAVYNFADERLKALNEYSSQLIREQIIPKITKEVNTAKRYASLRQVYYSLILAQWFKEKFAGTQGQYVQFLDSRKLASLTSQESWSKTTYFQAYQKSFKDGEYNLKEPASTTFGQTIRSYFSGGIAVTAETITAAEVSLPAREPLSGGPHTIEAKSQGLPADLHVVIERRRDNSAQNLPLNQPEAEKADIKERARKGLGKDPTSEEFTVIWQAHLTEVEGEKGDLGLPDKDAIYRHSTLSQETKSRKVMILKRSSLFTNQQIIRLGDYGAMGSERRRKPAEAAGAYRDYGANADIDSIVCRIDDFDRRHGKSIQKAIQRLMRKFAVPGSFLEAGSGFGRLWHYTADEYKKDWTSIDINRRMIAEAKRRGWGDKFVEGSIENTRFPDGKFNNVVGLASYDCVENLDAAIRDTVRVLAPSGRFIYMQDLTAYPLYITWELTKLFNKTVSGKEKANTVIWRDDGEGIDFWSFDIPENYQNTLETKYGSSSLVEDSYLYQMLQELVRQRRLGKQPDYNRFFFIQMRFAIIRAGLMIVYDGETRSKDTGGNYGVRYIVAEKPDSSGNTVSISTDRVKTIILDRFPDADPSVQAVTNIMGKDPTTPEDVLRYYAQWQKEIKSKGAVYRVERVTGLKLFGKKKATGSEASAQQTEEEHSGELDHTGASVRNMKDKIDCKDTISFTPGGIDFRNLPIVTQAINSLSADAGSIPLPRLNSVDLDSEWQQIEQLVSAGITPSGERIKEYLQASCYGGNITQDKQKVVLCISDILRQEEERCCATEPVLRDILVVLELSRSAEELKTVFLGARPLPIN